jgi:hypothetical protein
MSSGLTLETRIKTLNPVTFQPLLIHFAVEFLAGSLTEIMINFYPWLRWHHKIAMFLHVVI